MNKAILTIVGVWLIALTFLLLKPEPKFSSNSAAPIIAYVHGDSLHRGMSLITELEVTLQKNVEQVDSLLKTEAAPLHNKRLRSLFHMQIQDLLLRMKFK